MPQVFVCIKHKYLISENISTLVLNFLGRLNQAFVILTAK